MSPVMDQRTHPEALSGGGSGQLHVTSLIVHVRPDRLGELTSWLHDHATVEVPVSSPEGKLVIVTENDSERAIADLMQAIGDRPGVLNTAMVYHEIIEDDITEDEEDSA